MSLYDVAQVCLNGHCTNSCYNKSPDFNQDYCDKCGEPTITHCPECKSPIRGHYTTMFPVPYVPPDFCYKCGKPLPWFSRKMKAAVDLAQLEEVLSEDENTKFSEYVTDISKDTPSSQVSAKHIIKLLKKFSKSAAMEMRVLLVDIASESVKKIFKDPSWF
jgi:hypothetical protein